MAKRAQFQASADMHTFKHPRPVLFWLRWLVILGVLPAWVATAVTITASYERERASLERSTIQTSHAVMDAVDSNLASATAALQVLATSHYLASGNIAAFHDQARKVLLTQAGNGIALIDPSGQQHMSTLKQFGEPLPRTGASDLLHTVLKTAKPAISNFFIGATSGQAQVAVGVPVIRDGKVIYSLTMGILPDRLDKILREERLPSWWIAAILDRNGTIVARTHAADQFVGKKGSPALLRRIAEASEGAVNADTLEGSPILDTFSRSERSGLVVAIGIPIAELTGALHRQLWFSVAAASVAFLLALFLARHISLRIARSVRAMSDAALALAWGDPIVIPPVEIKEVAEVGRALAEAWRLLRERTLAHNRAEAQVREDQAELAHFSRVSLAGEMAAGMAHELSQPLTAIIAYGRGCLRLLAKPAPDPGLLKEGIQEVVQQAERAGDVLIRLREAVRRDASRQRFVAVRPLIQAAVALAAREAMQSQVDVIVRADPDLPLVLADNIEIEQVLLNLLLNAIDAMVAAETQRRSIVVEARRKGGSAVEISVADTGPGISDELKEKIFESFVTTKPRGMGMGLSISRHIIEAHGGSLRVLCSGSVGATFTFELPTSISEGGSDAA